MRKASEVISHLSYIIVDPKSDEIDTIRYKIEALQFAYLKANASSSETQLKSLYTAIRLAQTVLKEYYNSTEYINDIDDKMRQTTIYQYFVALSFVKQQIDVDHLSRKFLSIIYTKIANRRDGWTETIRLMFAIKVSGSATSRELSKATNLDDNSVRYRINFLNTKFETIDSEEILPLVDVDRYQKPLKFSLSKYGELMMCMIDPKTMKDGYDRYNLNALSLIRYSSEVNTQLKRLNDDFIKSHEILGAYLSDYKRI